MSGHSKWKNILHKKEKSDAQRAKVFTKIGREIAIAVREGGADPNSNGKLRDLIAKAKGQNVPNDNIERVIKKASGADAENFTEITYEGYGPSGVAVVVETATNNHVRTAAEMRHYFDKCGGNLGASNSVMWQFEKKGVLVCELGDISEDKLMEDAINSGASDFSVEDGVATVFTEPDYSELNSVQEAMEKLGYSFASSEVELIPSNVVKINSEEDIVKMQRLIDMLEDNDDVQNVFHNWDEPDDDTEE